MSWQILSPIIIVSAALVFIALERRFPYRPAQRLFRPGLTMDLVFYTLLQSWVLGMVIDFIIRTIDGASGLSRLHLVSGWPLWVQFAFFLVTHDLYIYLFHRLQHRSPILWRIHEAHHSTVDVDWLSGSRSHALEILINQTIEFAPIVLLGGHPMVAVAKVIVDAVWGMYIHTNINVRSGKLQYVLNGPEMHRWHHAVEIVDVNFSTKFAFWDWLFGTAYRPAGKPLGHGLADGSVIPPGYFRQQVWAFRGLGRFLAKRFAVSRPAPPAEPAPPPAGT